MFSFKSRFPFSGFRRVLGREDRAAGERERQFEVLVEAHLDAIYRTTRRLGVRAGDVEDLVQEVLVVLAQRMSDIEAGKERAFALGTAARLAASYRRKAYRRLETLVDEVDAELEESSGSFAPFGAAGEARVQHTEALAVLHAGLEAMTEPQRVTFVLFELEELRASEIAAELGVDVAAVVSRLQRARSVLRRVCRARGFGSERMRSALGDEGRS
jgi:RNA polymerase sigma-70 factor (ECF subfamily)